jgi:ribosome biogenesis GTPase
MSKGDTLAGLITRMQSGFFNVQTERGEIICRLRGRLKRGPIEADIAALGDRVEISPQADGTGMIETVLPRERAFTRLAPTARGLYQQVLLANPDQVVLVFALAHPTPHLRMLDRFLVIAEKDRIPALIVANKVDLPDTDETLEQFEIYPPLGYPVVVTSAETGEGVDELRELLVGKVSALAGPSGVGKSSLLNAIQPGLGLRISYVSERTDKGRHTTVHRELIPLEGGGFVADLPGMRQLALWDTQPEELDGYFREIAPLVEHCQYNDCSHRPDEPGCAVVEAVEAGTVAEERYESYLRLRYGEGEE